MLGVVIVSKFTEGAWIPTIVIPVIVAAFKGINRHYTRVAEELAVGESSVVPVIHHTVIIPVGRIHHGVLIALGYAKAMHPDHIIAVTVASDPAEAEECRAAWEQLGCDVTLNVIDAPYRNVTDALLTYFDTLDARYSDDMVTVLIPEFVAHRWWEHLLHNQSALALKAHLLFRKNTAVCSLPIHL